MIKMYSVRNLRFTFIFLTLILATFVRSEVIIRSEEIPSTRPNVTATTEPANVTGCSPPNIASDITLTPEMTHYDIGVAMNFSCANENATLIGAESSLCDDTGWTEAPPVCQEIPCYLDSPDNGDIKVIFSNMTSTHVTYSCQQGYELVGSATNRCGQNGHWLDHPPHCEQTCGNAFVPEHGYAHEQCTYDGCNATFGCGRGYRLSGDTVSHCAHNVWVHTEAMPNCTAVVCEPPPEVVNATVSSDKEPIKSQYVYSSVVTYTCAENYTLEGKDKMQCAEDGSWEGHLPNCIEASASSGPPLVTTTEAENETKMQCSAAVAIDNGQVQHNGDHLAYTCDSGYRLEGPRERLCLLTGIWSEADPVCVLEKLCPALETVTFANATFDPPQAAETEQHGFNTQVKYSCHYNRSVTFTLICGATGQWEGAKPHCKGPRVNNSKDLGDNWKRIFLNNRHWIGSYRYWEQPFRFQLWVIDQSHPNADYLDVVFEDDEAKLCMKVRYESKTLTFHKSKLFTPGDRFLPGHDWSFSGHVAQVGTKLWFYASHFHADKAFNQLQMTPRHVDGAIRNLDDYAEAGAVHNATALALGIVIAILLVFVAAGLAAYFVRAHAQRREGHRSTTSFENPVYDYANALKDSDLEPITSSTDA